MHLRLAARPFMLLAAVLYAALPGAAMPITYLFTGAGSGSVAGNPFSNAAFTIAAIADTNGVTELTDFQPGLFAVDILSAKISIAGIGEGQLLTSLLMFSSSNDGVVGLNRLNDADLLDIGNSGLFGYDLRSPIGPVTDPAPFWATFLAEPSTMGDIGFTAMQSVTFTATTAPEPGTIGLLALAALPAAALRRRRRTARGRG